MKKIYGFAALAATMMLASCSNDDQPNVVEENGSTLGYIAVSIVGDDTRADINAINGADESKVASATFVFYKGSEYVFHKTITTTTDGNIDDAFYDAEDATEAGVDRISSAILVVESKKGKTMVPDNMVTILNMPSTVDPTDVAKGTLLGTAKDFQTGLTDIGGKFVMSNSVYQANSATVDVTDISGKLYDTPALAQAHAVDVYVERVVARADIDNNLENTALDELTYIKEDGTTAKVTPTIAIQGVSFANRANNSRLVKSIAFGTEPTWTWNASNLHRSYWAVSTASSTDDFDNSKYTAITDKSDHSVYLQENTSDIYTSVLVTAQLQDANNSNAPIKLVRMLNGGNYFLEDGAKALLVQQLVGTYGYVTGTYTEGTEVSSLPRSFFEWKEGATYSDGKTYDCVGYLQLITKAGTDAANATILVKKNGKWVNAKAEDKAALNTTLASTANQCLVWNNGACYYYVDIKNSNNAKGIVRNHVYDLDLQTITGLGVPVVNPDKEIIPGNIPTPSDAEDWNLGAVINVLKWKFEHQDVNFSNN